MVASTAALVAVSLAVAVAAGPIYAFSERTADDLLDRNGYIDEVLQP
jgi:multicomponent Na+:H+ antiporter subunit D